MTYPDFVVSEEVTRAVQDALGMDVEKGMYQIVPSLASVYVGPTHGLIDLPAGFKFKITDKSDHSPLKKGIQGLLPPPPDKE